MSNNVDGLQPDPIESIIASVSIHYRSSLRVIMHDFITNKVSYQDSLTACSDILGTSQPIVTIQSLMDKYGSDNSYRHKSTIKRREFNYWSAIEDIRLLAGIHRYGLENFKQISEFVGNSRTRSQCTQRWNRSLNPLINKTPWTQEEDYILIQFVQLYGDHSWTKIANEVRGRTDVQCRYRYNLISKKYPSDLGMNSIDFINQKYQSPEPALPKMSKLHPAKDVTKVEIECSTKLPDLFDFQYGGITGSLHLLDLIRLNSTDPSSLFVLS